MPLIRFQLKGGYLLKRGKVNDLLAWKNNSDRKPLILRGARQVGKTWLVKDFARQHYRSLFLVDFEKFPELIKIYNQNLDPKRILEEIELFLGKVFDSKKDLLFFDEIQNCPKAIMALRYFYEELPHIHIIAAGSLLEFVLQDISVPVGRVEFMDMHPFTFAEFLQAIGKETQAKLLLEQPKPLSPLVHQSLLQAMKLYFFVGGMPECIAKYVKKGSLQQVRKTQNSLLDAYKQDFEKYKPRIESNVLNSVLSYNAQHVGQQVMYTKMAQGYSSPTIKKAFYLLTNAKLLYPVYATTPQQPLHASIRIKKMKALFLDIGLVAALNGMGYKNGYDADDLLDVFKGALAEQFVGQELRAAGKAPYYWVRDKRGSTAEVDFLIEREQRIFPIEVKSSASGALKSMHLLLQIMGKSQSGYVLSQRPFEQIEEQRLWFLPLYWAYSLANFDDKERLF